MGTSVPRGSVLDVAQTTVWGSVSWKTLHRGGRRGKGRATVPGNREPRPGKEQEKGLRLGHQRASPSTVSAKGLGEALGTNTWASGPYLPLPRPLDSRHLPPLCLWRQAHAGISPPPACPSRLQGTCRPFANHPSSDPSPLGLFFKLKFCFLKGNLLTCFKIKMLPKATY